jgi:hypothetical protein
MIEPEDPELSDAVLDRVVALLLDAEDDGLVDRADSRPRLDGAA